MFQFIEILAQFIAMLFFHFHFHLIPLDWIINYFLWILINNHFDFHTNYYQWTQPTRTTIKWVIWVLVLIPLHLMMLMLMLMLMLYNFDNESSCHWSFILIMIFNRLVFIYLIIILIISLINLFYFILIHMKKLSICLVGCEGHF